MLVYNDVFFLYDSNTITISYLNVTNMTKLTEDQLTYIKNFDY